MSAVDEEGTMANIWVLTQPADESRREVLRADVITSVAGSNTTVSAVRSDTQDVVFLAEWSTRFDKRDSLPDGFHIAFLQALDEARWQMAKSSEPRDHLVRAKWVINQQEWQ